MDRGWQPTVSRRRFLAGMTGAAAGGLLGALAAPAIAGATASPAPIPLPRGPRVVVVGGGWAGLTVAKYLRRSDPAFDVVLVERFSTFHSYPLSNLWLADQVELDFLSHSYIDAARNNDYYYLNASAVGLDRDSRRLDTSAGYLDYDYLVLAPGIDYDYQRMGIDDVEAIDALQRRYPAGFINMSEIFSIKRKLHEFSGGTFVITVPNDNYRCMAAPYERACMAASIFRRRGIAAKVLVLDMNPGITVKADGFMRAFETFYPDLVEYHPSAEISAVDPFSRTIETLFDEYSFDDAIIYPKVRASRLLESMGLVDPASAQRAAATDPFRSHLVDDPRVFVIGDSRSQAFSKSGNTAHTEARHLCRYLAARERDEEIPWEGPQTMCFSAVRADPLEAMSLIANYRYDEETGAFGFDKVHIIDSWSGQIATAGKVWADSMYADMFY